MYLYWTELFKIELFICIKMDLALNNLQRLICHKTQTNKQTNKHKEFCGLKNDIRIKECKPHTNIIAQSAGGVEYTDPPNEYPGYDTKQSDGEVPVMLGLWRMWSIPSLPGLLWFGMIVPDRVYELNRIKLHTYAKLNCLK